MRGSVTFGSFEFDPYSRLLKRDGVELSLPPRVLGVLEVLLRRAGDVVPRQELIDNVWKDAFVTDTSLAEAVSVLRQALGDDPQSPSFIQTFHRRGYRFVAPVAVQSPPSPTVPPTLRGVDGSNAPSLDESLTDGPSIGMELVPWSVAAACAILAAVAIWQAVWKSEPAPRPVTRFTIAPPANTRFDARAPAFALSADGSRLAFSACDTSGCRLYIRPSDRLEAVSLSGTDDAAAPFFSADGRWLAFFADGHLKKISVSGGAPVVLAEAADPLGGAWISDGRIVYAGAAPGLRWIHENGGDPVTLTLPNHTAGEVRHIRPAVVAHTQFLLLTISNGPEPASPGRVALLDLTAPSRPPVVLLSNATSATASFKETIIFATGSELQVVGFDITRARITGAAQTALAKLSTANAAPQFTASADGTSIVLTSEPAPDSPLFWTTPRVEASNGGSHEDPVPLDAINGAALSPDGRRVAGYSWGDGARADLWVGDLTTGAATRMTHGERAAAPVWNPDGRSLWFSASANGPFAIFQREVDSLQPARRVYADNRHAFPTSVSSDGLTLAITRIDPTTGADIWTVPAGGGQAQSLIRTSFEETAAMFSPDGRLLAYQSNDSGRWEIYTHRLSDHRRTSISTGGGTTPLWSSDGNSLFFVSGDRLMRAVIGSDGATRGTPTVWSHLDGARPVGIDGRGRLLSERLTTIPAQAAVLTLHWDREVRQLLGPPSPTLPR